MEKIPTCKICNDEINPYDYFTNDTKSYYLCSEKCADEIINDDIYHIKYCDAYIECKQINNLRQSCKFKEKYTRSSFDSISPIPKSLQFCHPSQVSMIKSNVKLLKFVEESDKKSTEVNNKTLKLTTDNIKLAKAMLLVSVFNLILIIIQIFLQIFSK